MTLWRLEWLRLTRTRRWIALVGVYVFFGLTGPFVARYIGDILDFAGGDLEGATIELPPPVPVDGLAQYVSNAVQIGTLVAVVVAAGALAFDAIPEMGVFLRTRVDGATRILVPRVVVTAAAIIAAFVLGALAAWYETWALIGAPDTVGVLAGIAFGCLFLVFVVALVAALAALMRSVLSTVMASIVILLVLPVVGAVDAIGTWLPSRLAGALGRLPDGTTPISDYLPAAAVTVIASTVLFLLAVRLADRREL